MSELQPAFAGAVGHCLHAAMILVPAPIEHDAGYALVLRDHRDLLANLGRLFRLLPSGDLLAGHRGDRPARVVVDELGVDVLVRAECDQARPLGCPSDLLAYPHVPELALRIPRA